MKNVSSAVILLAVALSSAPAAASRPTSKTLAEWVEDCSRHINRVLEAPRSDVAGKATVRFRRGEDGRPADIQIIDGNRALSEAALVSVRRLRLAALPEGFAPNTRITMHLLFGTPSNSGDFFRDRKVMVADAAAHNARLSNTQVASAR